MLFLQWLTLLQATANVRAYVVNDTTPLNKVPMVQTHDAASGHLPDDGLLNAWAKTQSCTMVQQLECGARSFDPRPAVVDGVLKWHHGSVNIDYLFAAAIEDITAWAAANPTELITMPIWACAGSGCMEMVEAQLASAGVPVVDTCGEFEALTYGSAKRRAALPGGGLLLAITGSSPDGNGVACSIGNYRPEIACTGYDGPSKMAAAALLLGSSSMLAECLAIPPLTKLEQLVECAERLAESATANETLGAEVERVAAALEETEKRASYGCWISDGGQADFPLTRLFNYMDEVSAGGAPSGGLGFQMQALWQESAASVVIGTLRGSSLVRDENESELNFKLAAAVRAGRWPVVNYLEINDACNGGADLRAALQEQFGPY